MDEKTRLYAPDSLLRHTRVALRHHRDKKTPEKR
jgi:hypothetical protein